MLALNKGIARYFLMSFLAFAGLAGCVVYSYDEYGSNDPDRFFGTQPGYHKLSEYFAVDVSGYLMRFYFTGGPTGQPEKIGVLLRHLYDRSDYGPRNEAFALSQDGRRLLFFDEPGAEERKPRNTKNYVVVADLYLLDADDGHRELLHPDVHRGGSGCIRIPRNYLPFGIVHSIGNIELLAYTTEREEISFEARRKSLIESGKKDEVCGPFHVDDD